MNAIDYHRRLFRNSILLMLGHGCGLLLAAWGAWRLVESEGISSSLFFLALCFGNATRFHLREASNLRWLIGVDRIYQNISTPPKP